MEIIEVKLYNFHFHYRERAYRKENNVSKPDDIREDTRKIFLNSLVEIANKAFDNRAGKVENTSKIPYRLIYRGEDNLFSCLQLGMLALEKQSDFLD